MKRRCPSTPLLEVHRGCSIYKPSLLTRFVFIGCALAALTLAGNAMAASRWETLEAIHAVENPSNSPRPGRFGELGAYQFRAMTWRMHTSLPFSEAIDRRRSDEVAVRHYEWLKTTLTRAGVEPSTYNIALAWNAGANAVITRRVSSASRNYAQRVENLATALNANSGIAMK
ncbi:MAG: hypothetical protein ABIZ81_06735 [Opitutaceae bacterium]